MRSSMVLRAVLLSAVLAVPAAVPAGWAQTPPSEASEIAACLCLAREVSALNSDMAGQRSAYHAAQAELARLDAQLHSARTSLDVNDPQAVAQFRRLLGRRDAAYQRSVDIASGPLDSVVRRYNARVNEYNARCANRPQNPVVLHEVERTLACPPSR